MAAKKIQTEIKYLIDTYGLRAALTTTQNSVRSAVINAIESGEMLIIKSVSKELKENDPEVYAEMQAISYKKYASIDLGANKAAAAMVEAHGGSKLFGVTPPLDRFRALAVARLHKLVLVSDGKALKDCQSVAVKCHLPAGCVIGIAAV
ncbi:hypothetical protein [Sphingomonas prati]|uniref:Uncharacterized protein n=1 Tax=Sphingomonas prati TaxID=1843237 RepID=A0A7W9BT49_9SPHN|nr:hypothetical protein [Sphingomonas prati]MBB5729128.1 hypothetical protein [Sphingomonas prati]GGE84869.1 hypothetical protein GCM10011404_17030 [Sphingomonas prati]